MEEWKEKIFNMIKTLFNKINIFYIDLHYFIFPLHIFHIIKNENFNKCIFYLKYINIK
jgi:hypothetical protein